MNSEFLITEKQLNAIAEAFNISIESVRRLHKEFCPIEDQILTQRLAHITRVLEARLKLITGNPQFYIEYVPYEVETPRRRGSSSIRWFFKKFTIYYMRYCFLL